MQADGENPPSTGPARLILGHLKAAAAAVAAPLSPRSILDRFPSNASSSASVASTSGDDGRLGGRRSASSTSLRGQGSGRHRHDFRPSPPSSGRGEGGGAGDASDASSSGTGLAARRRAVTRAAAAAKAGAAGDATAPPPRPVYAHRASIAIAYRTARGQGEDGVPARLPPPPANNRLQHAGAVVTLSLFFVGAVALPGLVAAAALAALVLRSAAAAAFLAAFAVACVLPAGAKSDAFRHSPVWDWWRRHFGLRAVVPPLPYTQPGRRYMVAQFPHATFPMGTLLCAAITDSPQSGMPQRVEGVVADILLRLPVFKHIFAAKGCHPADGATLARLLRTRSVAIIPEGVAGIFHGASRSAGERVYLSRRRGFVRAALVAGTPIIPVYTLGNSQLLSFVGLPGLSRRLRVSVGYFFGLGGTPYPHRPRMLTVVGDPLEVDQVDEPSEAQVDELHGRLCAALTALFDGHKALLGPDWAEKKLVIR